MNRIDLIGRISNDIELRYTQNNVEVVSFNLAVNRDKDNTDFIKINAFSGTAKLIDDYCKKGDKIAIEGSLRVSNYEDKNGNKRTDYNVLANRVEFLESKKEQIKETTKEDRIDMFKDFGDQIEISDDDDLPF